MAPPRAGRRTSTRTTPGSTGSPPGSAPARSSSSWSPTRSPRPSASPPGERADRFASLARAGRVLKAANPRARVYYDAGHSGWNAAGKQAAWLRQAGAASAASSDGIFSNVSNFHRTADEIAYDRGSSTPSAARRAWAPSSTPAATATAPRPTASGATPRAASSAGRRPCSTGEARIDAYLWVKLPGESDGCKGTPGTFTPSYAYDLAR